MGVQTAYNPLSLVEFARRIDPNGNQARIADVLNRTNEVLLDMVWQEANAEFANKTVQRLSLPTGTYRALNEGVSGEASSTKELWDVIGFLESYSEPDKKYIDNQPDTTGARSTEGNAFIEGMSQTFATNLIYGNTASNPRSFTGLAPRLAALNSAGTVLGAGGTGSDVTSIYIVQWGPNKVYGIFPRGSKMGLQHEDLGVQTKVDSNGKMWQVYRDHFTWDHGLVVSNPRCIGRYANLESTGTTSNLADSTKLKELITILNRMPNRGRGACLYVNPTVMSQIDYLAAAKSNVWYTVDNAFGAPTMTFRGTNPVRMVEAILDTETAIT
jgi:hypothetical protein